MKVCKSVCHEINEQQKMEDIPHYELDTLLGYFCKDVKKKDGSSCELDSLTTFN